MKKIAFLFLLLISINCAAQRSFMPIWSAGLTAMPDYGMGVVASKYWQHWGVYAGYSHTILGFSSRRFDSSQKISIGALYLLFDKSTVYPFYFSLGTDYNTYKDVQSFYRDKRILQAFDIQGGVGMMIQGINVGGRYDLYKNEMSIDVTWNFGKTEIKHKHKKFRR